MGIGKCIEMMDSAFESPIADDDVNERLYDGDFVVKLVDLRNESYPGREAHGILPIMVVGHKGMTGEQWIEWVNHYGTAAYGAGYAARMVKEGVDFKELAPTAGMGRAIREGKDRFEGMGYDYILQAVNVVHLVEKWPPLYNVIATEMAEEEMSLGDFVRRIKSLPSPHEVGEGSNSTLGDIIGRSWGPGWSAN